MPPLFGRKITPAFVTAQAEPDLAATEARVEDIDRKLLSIAQMPASCRVVNVDRLLDMRNAIRPPKVTAPADVPVIPGRAS